MKKSLACLLLVLTWFSINSHAQNIAGVINSYFKVTALVNANTITVANSAGLKQWDLVIIIQMDAAVPPFGNAGHYELCQVAAIVGNNVQFTANIARAYTPVGNNVQLVKVARYVNPVVTGVLTCAAYNSVTGTGGVLALHTCNSTLTLQANIDVTGKGFLGANSPFANPNGAGTDPLVNGANGFAGAAGAPGGGYGALPGGGAGGGGCGGGGGSAFGQAGGGGGVSAAGGAPGFPGVAAAAPGAFM
ncbi:MAG: hypothetical protein HKN22_02800, partial [Bacteroidia bacterium]|nr:hypothetical protein [Bacteroidia bacterium]